MKHVYDYSYAIPDHAIYITLCGKEVDRLDIAWGFGIPDQDICSTCLHKEKQLWDDTLSSINIRGN